MEGGREGGRESARGGSWDGVSLSRGSERQAGNVRIEMGASTGEGMVASATEEEEVKGSAGEMAERRRTRAAEVAGSAVLKAGCGAERAGRVRRGSGWVEEPGNCAEKGKRLPEFGRAKLGRGSLRMDEERHAWYERESRRGRSRAVGEEEGVR